MTQTQKRTLPLESIGKVNIFDRCSKGYFRLKWTEPDGTRGDTSGGPTMQTARAKATQINARLDLAVGPLAMTSLRDAVDLLITEGRSPYPHKRTNKPELWKPAQRNNMRKALNRCLYGHAGLRCMDIDLERQVIDTMRAQGGTYNMVRQNTSAMRAFLTWAGKRKYISYRQAEVLPRGALAPDPALSRVSRIVERADSPARSRHSGDAYMFVRDEDAPSAVQVRALGSALADSFPLWGAMAPELAANGGPRWGEQFQLTADDAHPDGCDEDPSAHIHIHWQINPNGKADEDRRCLPKGNSVRRIPLARESFTGYPLRDEMRKRVDQARHEQAAGTNPEALLFPAENGGMLWHTSFNADHLLPAMEKAGWPIDVYEDTWHQWDGEKFVERVSRRRDARLTWHSLRHRFARICVDQKKLSESALMAAGGWTNIATVQNRYYRSGDDANNQATAAFD
ncbi:site-specific integrase [Nocardioides sp. zg-1308]|uniref:site-specific integrase n=1 Tax=Nocardioides sp. zg-1308 TaxID=2736253 RepID=UPI00155796BF|nr:site-specific integrase [Nocardioides sp. zg-1308]NPD06521.1 site-specific integrase [Nocardioides sp. zg-1308]